MEEHEWKNAGLHGRASPSQRPVSANLQQSPSYRLLVGVNTSRISLNSPTSGPQSPTKFDATAYMQPLSLRAEHNGRMRPASAHVYTQQRPASAGRFRPSPRGPPPTHAWPNPTASIDLEGSLTRLAMQTPGRPASALYPKKGCACGTGPQKSREVLQEELMQCKAERQRLLEDNKMLMAEKRRMEGQLKVARDNVMKAEELLNNKERHMAPQAGLSQMFRSPNTTALVGKLRERVAALTRERDNAMAQLKDTKMDLRSTRAAELLSERDAFADEVRRQAAVNAALLDRLAAAEKSAAASATQATQATHTLKDYLRQGKGLPLPPPKLPHGNSLSSGTFVKTLQVLRTCHSSMLSQAQLIRAVFPRHVTTWEDLDKRASTQASIAGGGDVLRYLRTHVKRMSQELFGLPGASLGVDDEGTVQAGAAPVTYQQLLYGLAEHVRMLRSVKPNIFEQDAVFEVDMEELATVCLLFADEVDRLRGEDGGGNHEDRGANNRLNAMLAESSQAGPWRRRTTPTKQDSDQVQHNPLYSTEPPASTEKAGTFDDTARWEGAESNDAGQPYQQDNQPGGVMRQRAREFQGQDEQPSPKRDTATQADDTDAEARPPLPTLQEQIEQDPDAFDDAVNQAVDKRLKEEEDEVERQRQQQEQEELEQQQQLQQEELDRQQQPQPASTGPDLWGEPIKSVASLASLPASLPLTVTSVDNPTAPGHFGMPASPPAENGPVPIESEALTPPALAASRQSSMRKESPTGFASKQASMRREAPVAAQEGGQESVPEEQAEEAAASESQAPQAEQKGGMEQEAPVSVSAAEQPEEPGSKEGGIGEDEGVVKVKGEDACPTEQEVNEQEEEEEEVVEDDEGSSIGEMTKSEVGQMMGRMAEQEKEEGEGEGVGGVAAEEPGAGGEQGEQPASGEKGEGEIDGEGEKEPKGAAADDEGYVSGGSVMEMPAASEEKGEGGEGKEAKPEDEGYVSGGGSVMEVHVIDTLPNSEVGGEGAENAEVDAPAAVQQLLMEEGGDSDSDIEEEIVEEDNTEATPSGVHGLGQADGFGGQTTDDDHTDIGSAVNLFGAPSTVDGDKPGDTTAKSSLGDAQLYDSLASDHSGLSEIQLLNPVDEEEEEGEVADKSMGLVEEGQEEEGTKPSENGEPEEVAEEEAQQPDEVPEIGEESQQQQPEEAVPADAPAEAAESLPAEEAQPQEEAAPAQEEPAQQPEEAAAPADEDEIAEIAEESIPDEEAAQPQEEAAAPAAEADDEWPPKEPSPPADEDEEEVPEIGTAPADEPQETNQQQQHLL